MEISEQAECLSSCTSAWLRVVAGARAEAGALRARISQLEEAHEVRQQGGVEACSALRERIEAQASVTLALRAELADLARPAPHIYETALGPSQKKVATRGEELRAELRRCRISQEEHAASWRSSSHAQTLQRESTRRRLCAEVEELRAAAGRVEAAKLQVERSDEATAAHTAAAEVDTLRCELEELGLARAKATQSTEACVAAIAWARREAQARFHGLREALVQAAGGGAGGDGGESPVDAAGVLLQQQRQAACAVGETMAARATALGHAEAAAAILELREEVAMAEEAKAASHARLHNYCRQLSQAQQKHAATLQRTRVQSAAAYAAQLEARGQAELAESAAVTEEIQAVAFATGEEMRTRRAAAEKQEVATAAARERALLVTGEVVEAMGKWNSVSAALRCERARERSVAASLAALRDGAADAGVGEFERLLKPKPKPERNARHRLSGWGFGDRVSKHWCAELEEDRPRFVLEFPRLGSELHSHKHREDGWRVEDGNHDAFAPDVPRAELAHVRVVTAAETAAVACADAALRPAPPLDAAAAMAEASVVVAALRKRCELAVQRSHTAAQRLQLVREEAAAESCSGTKDREVAGNWPQPSTHRGLHRPATPATLLVGAGGAVSAPGACGELQQPVATRAAVDEAVEMGLRRELASALAAAAVCEREARDCSASHASERQTLLEEIAGEREEVDGIEAQCSLLERRVVSGERADVEVRKGVCHLESELGCAVAELAHCEALHGSFRREAQLEQEANDEQLGVLLNEIAAMVEKTQAMRRTHSVAIAAMQEVQASVGAP
eukprot:NODE_292_length_3212_cov_4.153971.p1 GENE.NODE_292_length_3212_cov_4.153971~~NODE_292_length_3212_cov_4.153971.p1  ORF type:complete len:896 (+),score=290.55 NODE_292_length_3212_cov_4.153971:293-2689(+)